MSMKQNGVPLGGALVAATLPVFASAYGWRNALVFGGAVSLVWVLAIKGRSYRLKELEKLLK
jgi:hypothetical protein